MPTYYKITTKNKKFRLDNQNTTSPKVIVSLTSFPNRIDKVWLVVETILRQTMKPDMLILWLSKNQFTSINQLPKNLRNQMLRGLQISFVDEDIRSYKKFYYSLKQFQNEIIITIDDDIFYEAHLIERLMNFHLKNKNTIISAYAKNIIYNNIGLEPYSSWPLIEEETKPGFGYFFGTGGGTLFPPRVLDNDIFNKELFLSLAPTADDIWINTMCRLKSTQILCTGRILSYFPIYIKNNDTLDSINNGLSYNDVQLTAVINYYKSNKGIDPYKIFEN